MVCRHGPSAPATRQESHPSPTPSRAGRAVHLPGDDRSVQHTPLHALGSASLPLLRGGSCRPGCGGVVRGPAPQSTEAGGRGHGMGRRAGRGPGGHDAVDAEEPAQGDDASCTTRCWCRVALDTHCWHHQRFWDALLPSRLFVKMSQAVPGQPYAQHVIMPKSILDC